MHPLIPAIAFFALCAVLGDALKAFGMDFVDLIVMTAVWIALPIFVLDRIAPPKFQAWATRRTETESAWLMLAPPFAVAVVGWYLVDWHSGPFSRMHGFTAFCVLYYLSVPVGLGLMVLLGPELLDDSHRTVGGRGGGGGSGARPMGPRDYGGMTIDQPPARSPADEKAFAFDPARFGKTGEAMPVALLSPDNVLEGLAQTVELREVYGKEGARALVRSAAHMYLYGQAPPATANLEDVREIVAVMRETDDRAEIEQIRKDAREFLTLA